MSNLHRFVERHKIKSAWELRGSLTFTKAGWTTEVHAYVLNVKFNQKEMRMPVVIPPPHRSLTALDALAYLASRHKKKLRLFLGERLYREFRKVA